ncbi:MAG TPA: hypothetical protein VF664_14025, partial [Cystobacter sp.]
LALSGPLADSESSPDSEQSWHEPERRRAPLGLRLLTEVGAGAITAMGGLLVGGVLGAVVCERTDMGRDPSTGCLGGMLVGGFLGLAQGYALGVWWGGEVVGGDGSLLLTLLGGALGTALSIAFYRAAVSDRFFWYSMPVPIVLGPHLGYELSQRSPPAVSSRPGIQPMVSFSSRGALLGLGGRF